MAGVIRDLQCGQSVSRMAELGRFDEEFFAYGCAWYEKNEIHYFLSGNSEDAYEFAIGNMMQKKWTTPIESCMQRRPVPSEMRDEYNQQIKVKVAYELQKKYSKNFFEAAERLGRTENTNSAYDELNLLKEELEGVFHKDKLMYFDSIVQSAYMAKKITNESYQFFKRWIKKNFRQMEDDIIVEERYHKVYGGFYYKKSNGDMNIYMNAEKSCVYEEWNRCLKEGYITFPIFWKTYWFASIEEGRILRQKFKDDMDGVLQESIGKTILKIKQLPPTISLDRYYEEIEKMKHTEDANALKTLGGYWDLF